MPLNPTTLFFTYFLYAFYFLFEAYVCFKAHCKVFRGLFLTCICIYCIFLSFSAHESKVLNRIVRIKSWLWQLGPSYSSSWESIFMAEIVVKTTYLTQLFEVSRSRPPPRSMLVTAHKHHLSGRTSSKPYEVFIANAELGNLS